MAKEIMGQEYNQWLSQLKNKIRDSQLRAALKVNAEMLALYWELGRSITEKQAQSDWGDKIITQLSADLSAEFKEIKGFSATNLKYIRKWYQFYTSIGQQRVDQLEKSFLTLIGQQRVDQIVQKPVGQLSAILGLIPWGHHIQIFTKSKNVEEALFYIQQTAQHNWKRSVLIHHIDSGLYQRKGKALTNFEIVLPKNQSELANELLKNPYNLDFLSLSEEASERELEKSIINNIKKFLLELGSGFAFVGQQYHLQVSDKDFYLDLLFYHTRLHCYLVIELKVTEFKAEYAGKLEFYITAIDEQIKTPEDHPTIGLLMCKTVDKIIVEYSLKTKTKPIGVAEYKHSIPEEWKNELPDIEALKQELEKEIAIAQKPIDEKLNRLKTFVQNINNKEARNEKSHDRILEIIEQTIYPLQTIIEKKLEEITVLFNHFKTAAIYNGTIFNNEASISKISAKLNSEENIWMIGIEFSLDGFKKAGTKAFDVWYRLEVQFEKYKYSIGPQRGQIWGEPKLYGQHYNEYEIEQISDQFIELILDDLNRRIEQL